MGRMIPRFRCGYRLIAGFAAVSALLATAGCGSDAVRKAPADSSAQTIAGNADSATATPKLVFLGTSLTAGRGLDPEQAYPALIQQKIDSAGLNYEVINAGVSGETSAGALRRIDWVMRQPVSVLVIETGANDGLRGLNIDSLRADLIGIIARARQQQPPPTIALVQMEAPTNLGRAYTRRFHEVYPTVARETGVVLLPFLLDGVAGIDSLNQADGIHPNVVGERIVADNVWRAVRSLLAGATAPVSRPAP
ncbi:MAG TPA: arylesterase [Gemmatimonadales bacterium]|nr:arylesterase [Gemmatimonadales bacterium]